MQRARRRRPPLTGGGEILLFLERRPCRSPTLFGPLPQEDWQGQGQARRGGAPPQRRVPCLTRGGSLPCPQISALLRQPLGRKRDGLGGGGSAGRGRGLKGPSLSLSVYLPRWFIFAQASLVGGGGRVGDASPWGGGGEGGWAMT